MGKGALRPFFKGHSLKKEKEHEKKEVDKMLSHFVTLPFFYCTRSVSVQNKEMEERHKGDDKTIVRKGGQRRLIQEFQEPEHGNIGDDKRGHKADGNHGQIAASQHGQTL